MKILYIYSSPINHLRGGIQKVTYTMAKQFKEVGHEVLFLSCAKKKSENLEFPQLYIPKVKKMECNENVKFLIELIEKEWIDVVINQAGMSHDIHRMLSRAKTIHNYILISCIHNSIFGGVENYDRTHRHQLQKANLTIISPLFRGRWMKSLLCKLYIEKNKKHYQHLCKESNYVVVLTRTMHQEIKRMTGGNYMNIIQIPNGTPLPDDSQICKEKEKFFLYVGKLDFGYKRVDLLLPIWKCFSEKKTDYHLHILGGGEAEANLKRQIVEEGITNVIFDGWKNPTDYYKKAQGIIMTSCSEGLPMVLIEAMSYGVIPFVYDAFEHIHEIIDDRNNGFLAPDNCPDQMAGLMNYVIENRTIAKSVAHKAIEKSYDYDSRKIATRWLNLIKQ